MSRCVLILVPLFACSFLLHSQTSPSLKGIVSDPANLAVPGVLVQVIGPGGQQRQATGDDGHYSFPALRAGKYQVRFIAKGFTAGEKRDVNITAPVVLDYQLTIEANAQVINVEDEANSVSTDPASNAATIVIGPNQIDSLSDDPDILQQQLLALAGPGSGPNGGGIYVDGFSGAQLPPKASIQEIRVNANPYSPENEFPGGGGIQIITKPGTSTLHGGLNFSYNKEALNSRSPLLAQSKRPQYKQENLFGNVSGQLIKNKASWSLFFSRNAATQNAFIYATTLDNNLNPVTINQTVLTPRGNWNVQPRLDYAINKNHTLNVSFFNGHNHVENLGVGDFGLPSRAYNNYGNNNQLQISETAILSPRMISDTKFQYFRNLNNNTGDNTRPAIVVPGAFTGGGAQVGNSGAVNTTLELVSSTSFGYKAHTLRWGGRLRENLNTTVAVSNFGGTYTFQGGTGPLLDADNQPTGLTTSLTGLEVYRRTLLFQRQGLSDTEIRSLGGGAYQFSLNAGQPSLSLRQLDAGLYFVDDWRARPNVTFSYGLRYEVQNNIADHGDFAPRIAVAWNPGRNKKPGKTVYRAGVGAFYTRIPISVTQSGLRFNGLTQQSYILFSPSFFPSIPSSDILASAKAPQQLQLVDSTLRASQLWQASIGADRQLGKLGRLSMNYSASRGIHLQRARDINAPVNSQFPFSDSQIRILTEATGFSRTQQITITPTVNYKKFFLAGFYTLSFGKSDSEGLPADPYNLRAEWGPSTFSDVRHRLMVFSTTPLPTKYLSRFSLSAQFMASSGAPYNITSGRDLNGDSLLTERPSIVPGVGAPGCNGGSLLFEPAFGCFNLNPAAGTSITRNSARGPSQINLFFMSLSRTWVLNPVKEVAGKEAMVTVPGPGGTMISIPASMMGNMGGAAAGKRKYSLTFSVNAVNPLNHPTYAPPSGDLSSPYFGVYRSISSGNQFGPGGNTNTFNRQVNMQLRLNF